MPHSSPDSPTPFPPAHTGPINPHLAATAEGRRLLEDVRREKNWKRWGPYLAERQWGTVREDYSHDGDCWNYFPHDHARSRAYRWGEDGILGITDRECRLCFSLAMWNGADPFLKERLFGLTGPQGNHGEDVKESYFYLDSTPTHSYMKGLYKYPHAAYPYDQLLEESARRSRVDPEFELADTGVFDDSRYFDVQVEYAKAGPDDILIRATITNRAPLPPGSDAAPFHFLPTLWYRNTWSWGCTHEGCWPKPRIDAAGVRTVVGQHASLGATSFVYGDAVLKRPDERRERRIAPTLLFTDNETNTQRLYDFPGETPYVRDSFHQCVVDGRADAVNPDGVGTKVAGLYRFDLCPGESAVVRMRMRPAPADATPKNAPTTVGDDFDAVFAARQREADDFYAQRLRPRMSSEARAVARQAYAGLLWSKQFYHYSVKDWLEGDPLQPVPPEQRKSGRNAEWTHLFNRDVISMPDKWEYPWFAAWDLAFHVVAIARIDAEFAKEQLILFLREWYMHPNGQIPAYEFAFNDVNPPVHAWAAWRIYKMTGPRGKRDRVFLARVFHKLLINFTWWVNRKDPDGHHLFSGGFLGLDNIGVFDRSKPLAPGVALKQADATAWMAFYCCTMLSMALELASEDPAYDDVSSKFFEHFVSITDAMNHLGGTGLWDDEEGFYYDQLLIHSEPHRIRLRSMVGLIPLFAVEVLEEETIQRAPGFRKRMEWFLEHRRDLAKSTSYMRINGDNADPDQPDHSPHPCRHRLLAVPSRERLQRVLAYMLDENEFLSPHGVRSLSRHHLAHPYTLEADGRRLTVAYAPGESDTDTFGGNSNWRGPVWFPVNYLLIEALERYHHFFGDSLTVECPTGSGNRMNLDAVAHELRRRLSSIFLPGPDGRRPCHADDPRFAADPHWKNLLLFHEYFHADTGKGLGASHQTGWTGLVAEMLSSE